MTTTTQERSTSLTDASTPTHGSVGMADDVYSQSLLEDFLTKNAYSDPIKAILREYAANARDAVLEAGLTLTKYPVEITLPNQSNNWTFTCTDHGIGMDTATIIHTVGKLMSSTKREETTSVGHFGVGAKAGYAATNHITVTSVKDGKKVIITLSKNPDAVGKNFDVLFETDTNEANGTTITFAISASYQNTKAWETKAIQVFHWWASNTIMVDRTGSNTYLALNHIEDSDDFVKFADSVYFQNSHNGYKEKMRLELVMGGICYPVPYDQFKDLISHWTFNQRSAAFNRPAFWVEVENKCLDPLLSREGLVYNEKTKTTLARVISNLEKAIIDHDNELIKLAQDGHTPRHAQNFTMCVFDPYHPDKSVTWHGEPIMDMKLPAYSYATVQKQYNRYGNGDELRLKLGQHSFNAHQINHPAFMVVENCGDTKIETVRTHVGDYLRRLGVDLNDSTRVIFRVKSAQYWEKVHDGITKVDYQVIKHDVLEAAKLKRKEAREAKKAKEQAQLERIMAHNANPENEPIELPSTSETPTTTGVYTALHSLRRNDGIDDAPYTAFEVNINELKPSDYPLVYIIKPNDFKPDIFKAFRRYFWARDEKRLIIEHPAPATMERMLKDRGITAKILKSDDPQYYRVDIGENEFKHAHKNITQVSNYIDLQDNFAYYGALATVFKFTRDTHGIEIKNTYARKFFDEVYSLQGYTYLPHSKYFGRYNDSQVKTWIKDNALLYHTLGNIYNDGTAREMGKEFVEYINWRKVPLVLNEEN